MNFIQNIKDRLVQLGPAHPLLRLATQLHARRHGYAVQFSDSRIAFRKQKRVLYISTKDYVLAPFISRGAFDFYFRTMVAESRDGLQVLDFSKPCLQRYSEKEITLSFPGIPEDECMDAYTARFTPREGMTVFDAGAHAGLTTCFLSRMVGATGRVYAFEPDNTSRRHLLENVKSLNLTNVTVLDSALGERSGRAEFNMDGTMCAGLVDFQIYGSSQTTKEVEVVTLEECCKRLGVVPDFIKMDIEGAEVGVVAASLDFLKRQPIHFAVESEHRTKDGKLTCHELEPLFRSIGYNVESSKRYGPMTTWATPPPAL